MAEMPQVINEGEQVAIQDGEIAELEQGIQDLGIAELEQEIQDPEMAELEREIHKQIRQLRKRFRVSLLFGFLIDLHAFWFNREGDERARTAHLDMKRFFLRLGNIPYL